MKRQIGWKAIRVDRFKIVILLYGIEDERIMPRQIRA